MNGRDTRWRLPLAITDMVFFRPSTSDPKAPVSEITGGRSGVVAADDNALPYIHFLDFVRIQTRPVSHISQIEFAFDKGGSLWWQR